jgi:hypothetical protein
MEDCDHDCEHCNINEPTTNKEVPEFIEIEYEVMQTKSYVPAERVAKDYQVNEWRDGIIFIHTPDGWIEVDTVHKKFQAGEYEG